MMPTGYGGFRAGENEAKRRSAGRVKRRVNPLDRGDRAGPPDMPGGGPPPWAPAWGQRRKAAAGGTPGILPIAKPGIPGQWPSGPWDEDKGDLKRRFGGLGQPRGEWKMGTTWQERKEAGPDWRQELGMRPGAGVGGGFGGGRGGNRGMRDRAWRRTPPGPPQVPQPADQWGAGNAYDAGSTTDQIARNEYLNSLPVGGAREAAMNAMGYWSGGVPQTAGQYTGSAPEGLNPGEIWQAQQPGGGYAGVYTGQAGGAPPTFTSFAATPGEKPWRPPSPMYRGRGRLRRRAY